MQPTNIIKLSSIMTKDLTVLPHHCHQVEDCWVFVIISYKDRILEIGPRAAHVQHYEKMFAVNWY